MLGNWSLGDYWKKEAIEYSFKFLTEILKIPKENLAVSIFAGSNSIQNIQRDNESANFWISLGIPKEKIIPVTNNWWGPAGKTGPCGPDTEMFCWKSKKPVSKKIETKDLNDKNWIEIWNDVFMEYNKDKKLILVGGMYCLYDKNFKINKELLEMLDEFNTHTILTVNKFREKGFNLIREHSRYKDTNWKAFSLEERGIKKDNIEYFKELIKKFNLVPEEIIYFDHDKKNIETAKKLGILSKDYNSINQIKKFIEENLWMFIPLKQKNVDTGMGVERTLSILNNLDDNYLTDCFLPIIKEIEKLSGEEYEKNKREMRIIADHLKASVFIINDGIIPSNTEHGYVLRRLIRRAIRYGMLIGLKNFIEKVAESVFEIYSDYKFDKEKILNELKKEEEKFNQTLEKGINRAKKMAKNLTISGRDAFLLYQSYGFPLELTKEILLEFGSDVDEKGFYDELKQHQELSRTATAGKFKSGLADNSVVTTKLHTATHLLLSALKIILKDEKIIQKGSNITPERLRLDFSFLRKLTKKEINEIENLVNEQIKKEIPVIKEELTLEEAKKSGARGIFDDKYGKIVSVYTIGNFSKEICTGPHVKNTKELGKFKIIKEESSSNGVRRIKAELLKN
jgi:alanyl-tRNA synthetase